MYFVSVPEMCTYEQYQVVSMYQQLLSIGTMGNFYNGVFNKYSNNVIFLQIPMYDSNEINSE